MLCFCIIDILHLKYFCKQLNKISSEKNSMFRYLKSEQKFKLIFNLKIWFSDWACLKILYCSEGLKVHKLICAFC